ncbi:sugar (Glycoside-Pentoside-Hexuronide) transporter [Bacillus cereus BAG6X1-2]|nr:sugar (Glycoside-Pentoside-Hexuronide) transporter [Bacillus cereus BAG6X1-2]
MNNFKRINTRFALGGMGQNLVYVLMSSSFLFYFTEAAGFSAATIGTLLLVVRIYGLIVDPMIAVAIEKTNTKWGKYRPYITFMPPIISLLCVAVFYHPNLSQDSYLIYIYIITLLFWTAYAFFDISFWSMVPSITKEENMRMKLLTTTKMAVLFVSFGLGIVLMPVIKFFGDNDYSVGFLLLSIILAIIFTVCGLILANSLSFMNNTDNNGEKRKVQEDNIKVSDMLRALIDNKPLIVIILSKLCIYLAVTIKGSLAIYFYKYNLGNDTLGSISSLVSLPVTLILVALTPKFMKKYSDKVIMLFMLVIHTGISLIYILNTDISTVYLIIDGVSSAALGVYSLIITNMVASTVEYGEWKTKVRLESIIFSTNTISSKLATGISAAIAGWVLTGIGYVPGMTQSASTLNKLHQIMVWIPVVGIVIGAIILLKYTLTSKMYKEIVKELESRKQERKVQ